MGLVHALSPYESDHLAGMQLVDRYMSTHDGALPAIPWVDFLRHRFDLSRETDHLARFTYWHPNLAAWFEQESQCLLPFPPKPPWPPTPPTPPWPPTPPIDPCPPDPPTCIGCDPCPPVPGCSTTPEPASVVSLAVALCLGLLMRRRWFA